MNQALQDLDEIYGYIASNLQEPGVAAELLDALESEILSLEYLPYRCSERRTGSFANSGYRQLMVKNYIVIYRIDEAHKQVCTTEQPTEQFNIFAKAEVSTKRLLRLFFFPGIFTRTQSGTMLCLSAETEAVRRDTPMCEERQTHSDRTLPGLTSPIRSAMRETATSSLSLKHRLTCYRSSAFIRRTGRQGAILPWAAFRAKPLTVFFLNARTPEKCSSALTATPQEVKPAPGWHSPFPARSPSFALSRQGKTGTMFSVSKGTFPAANS